MDDALARAERALRAGRLVVYPTDTLFGLGARASDRRAVGALIALKGRAPDQPIGIAVSSVEEIEPWASIAGPARQFLRTRLPGPFTALLAPSPAARRAFPAAVAGGARIGVRVPDHPLARELARRVGPITATSANRHGAPPPSTVAAARRAFGPAVAVYLDGPPRPTGTGSTLVDLTGPSPRPVPRGA
ncbi:MAG TPA: L-threonylcarbamoyladenylate synthase [Thermoplasmata archaeon]|nr:L-threonylcarbamoyladenylate synthase [Thermoplasmata archaeon]